MKLCCLGCCADMVALCRSILLASSEVHLDAIMRSIYEAMVALEAENARLQGLGVKVDRIRCALCPCPSMLQMLLWMFAAYTINLAQSMTPLKANS